MTTAVLTPFVRGKPQSSGRLWWHKLLPVGDIEYRLPDGTVRTLKFTKDYNDGLQQSFNARAYDQVPFQLAGDANIHTNKVAKGQFGGDIVQFDSREDGLWIALAPSKTGEEYLLENPRLGVSARIVEDYARSDGKFYPAAVQHVLGTLDPRIPGLGVWQPIDMANQPDRVLDLTGAVFAGQKDDEMPLSDAEQARLAQLLQVPQDDWNRILSGLQAPGLTPEELALLTGDFTGEDELSDDDLAALLDEAARLDAAGLLDDFQPAGAGVGMSQDVQLAIDLTNYRSDEMGRQLALMQGRLADEQFVTERRVMADAGIPPFITDLARPLLTGTNVINLSSGGQVDAGQVMRRVLTEVGKLTQLLDLSGETGSGFDEPAAYQQGAQGRTELVARFRTQTGL